MDRKHVPWNRRANMNTSGIVFPLFLVLVMLKLAGVITWGWWIITLPIWGTFVLFMVALMILTVIAALPEIAEILRGKR